MATATDMETIELSEAIKTILEEGTSPARKDDSEVSITTPRSRKAGKSPKGLSASFTVGQNTTPNGQLASRKGSDTPLSRKSSILQRSSGGASGSCPRKRRHAQEVIILRPPKKRASGSTPRITSTSKHTPSSQSTPKPSSTTPSLKKSFQSTPVSSQNRSRIIPSQLHVNNMAKSEGSGLKDAIFLTPDLSMTPRQVIGGENPSPKERENLADRAKFLGLMEQQGFLAGGVDGGDRMQVEQRVREQIAAGGLSLNVADQTSRISLVARGNQDDSLTNITWLRRMSAPDLDPITLQHIKSQDPHKERPPYSYSSLIQFAISSAPEGKLTLRDIYFWIETHFPYFRTAKLGWKNSIRHNLSLHKIFVREAPSGPGQPAFWTLRPGTVVRLPERKVIVHEEMGGLPAGVPECFAPEGSIDMAEMANLQMQVDPSMNHLPGNNILVGDASSMPMLSTQDGSMMNGAPVLTSTPVVSRPNMKGSKRIPPILPKGTPPYALVPLPIYFTTDPKTGQLVPANGENLPQGAEMMSPSLSFPTKGNRLKNIAPKFELNSSDSTPLTRMERASDGFGRVTLDSGYGSTDSSLGEDGRASLVRDSKALKNMVQAKGSSEKENSLSAEFGFGLDVDDDLLKTPPKGTCPDWLSPIRGFSPVPDTGFSIKDMDFNFTPFKTGFTPNNRMGHSNTPRHLMLSPVNRNIPSTSGGVRSSRKSRVMTPKRYVESKDLGKDYLLNSSFENILGDVTFVDPDNIDVGNMSWLLNSPPPVK